MSDDAIDHSVLPELVDTIAAYPGKSDAFDKAIVDFSERYADQNDRDCEAFSDAIRTGGLQAVEGV